MVDSLLNDAFRPTLRASDKKSVFNQRCSEIAAEGFQKPVSQQIVAEAQPSIWRSPSTPAPGGV